MELFTLTNSHDLRVKITNYGGIVVGIETPDRHGRGDDIVLGFDDVQTYQHGSPYFGALVGRYANRIAKGMFTLDGHLYRLAINNGVNHIHGGLVGFDKVVWAATPIAGDGTVTAGSLRLNYTSRDGEEGYPGNLKVEVTYTLTEDNSLRIDYAAKTDKKTVLNLTNHSYFNLAPQLTSAHGDILGHHLRLHADHFTPLDETLIPTGERRSVSGTPLDFQQFHQVGDRIDQDDEQLRFASGYDHNFVINGYDGSLRLAAEVYEDTTGRTLEVWTTQPGVQFYTGNFLDGLLVGKHGQVYKRRHGFCLETQHFPDSPNKPDFPSTVLKPGELYQEQTVYRFGLR